MKLIALAFLCISLLSAQSGIRPNKSGDESIQLKDNTFEAEGVTLKQLIQVAYNMPASRIFGPLWINDDTFDVPSMPKASLKSAIDSAFALKTHPDKRLLLVWVLSGNQPTFGAAGSGSAHIKGKALSMATIASSLSQALGKPVVDETGLQGRYDLDLSYDHEDPSGLTRTVRKSFGLKMTEANRELPVLLVDSATNRIH